MVVIEGKQKEAAATEEVVSKDTLPKFWMGRNLQRDQQQLVI